MKILVTGGTGFIGYNLINSLLNYNSSLDVTALGTSNELILNPSVKYLNYLNYNYKSLDYFDIVFHQAANNDTQLNNKTIMLNDNYYHPCKLFDFLYKKGCRKFIYASSCAVYGNAKLPYHENDKDLKPLTFYGFSKKMFDDFAMSFYEDASVIGLRYSNVYGFNEHHKSKRASMIFQIINKIKNNEDIVLFKDGTQKRDWVFINDIVSLNILAVNLLGHEILNCGSGVATSFNDLIEIIGKYFNWQGKVSYIENNIDSTYQSHTCCDINKIKHLFNWIPTPLEEGIKKTIMNLNS